MTDEMLARVVERRGYDDIDPENAWEEWQAMRPSLALSPPRDAGR